MMTNKRLLVARILLVVTIASSLWLSVAPSAPAQANCRLFKETGHSICGRFLEYWNMHGGIPQQGFPISDTMQEKSSTDGKLYTIQYFERAVFELHTENQPPYDVLLGLLGTSRYQEYYGPGGASNQRSSKDNPLLFPQTGHTLGGSFRAYWESNGGLAQQGYPISEEFTEISGIDGKPYTVQYFERAVFEMHPENRGTPYLVLLSQLGAYRHHARYGSLALPDPSAPGLIQIRPRGGNAYLTWTDAKLQYIGDDSPLKERVPITSFALNLQSGEVITTTSQAEVEAHLATSGPIVVWAEERHECGCGYDVHAEDLTTGAVFPVVAEPGNRMGPAIADKTVAYIVSDIGKYQLVTKDLDTGIVTVLVSYTASGNGSLGVGISYPLINDKYVVWVESRSSSGHKSYDLRVYNRKTQQIQTTTPKPTQELPFSLQTALSGQYLIWTDPALHITNLDSGQTSLPFQKEAYFPVARGDTVIWSAKGGSGHTVWGLKLSKPTPTLLATVHGYSWQSTIAGDWLAWEEDGRIRYTSLIRAFDATSQPGKP